MWSISFLVWIVYLTPVASQGPRLVLQEGKNPCEGYITIYYQNKWGIVGDSKWIPANEDVVCRSIGCGKAQGSIDVLNINNISVTWLNEIVCTGNEKHLWECSHPGWNTIPHGKKNVKYITCSDQIGPMELYPFKCAGDVRFNHTTGDGKTTQRYVCVDNWSNAKFEADLVCSTLGCGNHVKINDPGLRDPNYFWNAPMNKIKCIEAKQERHLWQCRSEAECRQPLSIICADHGILKLQGGDHVCSGNLVKKEGDAWNNVTCRRNDTSPDQICNQLRCGTSIRHTPAVCDSDQPVSLECSENVTVTLKPKKGEEKPCYGSVYIKSSGAEHGVCGTNWDKTDGEVVCKELGCGRVINTESIKLSHRGIMDQVKCTGTESSLWHCDAKYGVSQPFQCATLATVVCADSLRVQLSDGLGRCAGRVEIEYLGQWWKLSTDSWVEANSNRICNDLDCGDADTTSSGSSVTQGSTEMFPYTVKCDDTSKSISDCVSNTRQTSSRTPKELTCQKHKVVILRGDKLCSGKVGIKQSDREYWLSGSDETWTKEVAEVVCRQMDCGNTTSLYPVSKGSVATEDFWKVSYSCSSGEKSLFDCSENSGSNPDSIAYVTCSDQVTIQLQDRCIGKVEICVNGICGGVCADSWTSDKSKLLCNDLGCGKDIIYNFSVKPSVVTVKSIHTTSSSTGLYHTNIIQNKEKKYCETNPLYLMCSGSIKSEFQDARDKCSGNLAIFYGGKEHQVCSNSLNQEDVQNVICREMGCGRAVKVLPFFGSSNSAQVVNSLTCTKSSKSLAECEVSTNRSPCTLGGLRCEGWKRMSLMFLKDEGDVSSCEGYVFINTEGKTRVVSSDGWTSAEARRLCKDLSCGDYRKHSAEQPRITKNKDEASIWWDKSYNCTKITNPKTIWDCEHTLQIPATKKQLYLKCQDTFPEIPKVTFSNNCSGVVKFKGQGLCADHWTNEQSDMVCLKSKCSSAISFGTTVSNREGFHVSCEGSESGLEKCKTTIGQCKDQKQLSVYCSENTEFSTNQKCGGVIKIKYRDSWEKICPLDNLSTKNLLCREMKCGDVKKNEKPYISKTAGKEKLETSLKCNENSKFIKHCIAPKSCQDKPAEIYCEHYEPPKEPDLTPVNLIVGLCLLAVALVIITIVVVCLRKRIINTVKSRLSAKDEEEFQSGSYEDIETNANEMIDLTERRQGFRSQVVDNPENDASSFSYDDIIEEGQAESQTLTHSGERASIHCSEADYINDDVPVGNEDVVMYEVEEPQKAQDGEGGCENEDTVAEIHARHTTQPGNYLDGIEGSLGDDDYIQPDEEG